jgi:uncharacterized protein YjdB
MKKKRIQMLWTWLLVTVLSIIMAGNTTSVQAATSIKKYHNIDAYQQKDIYATATVPITGIKVLDEEGEPIERQVQFKIFNSTKQEVEEIVSSQNGVLSTLNLIKDHNYIIFAEDEEYQMENAYLWVKGANNVVDIKHFETQNEYSQVTQLQLSKRTRDYSDSEFDRRRAARFGVQNESGGTLYNVAFEFVSDVETVSANSGNSGKIYVELLEDVTYMVTIKSDQYDVQSFPLAIKDKSEYPHVDGSPGGKYWYDHSSCGFVENITLVKKGNAHKNDTKLVSISGDTSITGLNFKDFLLFDKKVSKNTVTGLSGKDYDVFDFKVVNPHRWEVSKLAAGEFKVTKTLDSNKAVANVYYVDAKNELQKITFTQSGKKVSFTMNSLSLYPVVIEYKPTTAVQKISISGISQKIAAGKSIQLSTEVTPANATDRTVTWTSSNTKYATVTAKGKVTTKSAGAGHSVTITATAKDGSKVAAPYKITIMKHAVKSISLKSAKTVKAGKTLKIKSTVKTSGKSVNKTLKWTSSNTAYATVSSKGIVKATPEGKGKTVTITASATDGSGKKKTVKIKIK